MREIEFKILATPEAAARIADAPALAALAEGPPETLHLRTVYHDTAAGALEAAGIALRMRFDGQGWTQTVKTARAVQAGLSEARESNTPMPGETPDPAAIPDAGLAARVQDALGDAPLAPVFATVITRTTRRLALPGLGRVEMALDEGEIRAGDRAAPLTEIEFELIEGSPRAVFEAVRRVVPAEALTPSTCTKADRGALLARTGAIHPEPRPRKAKRVALDPGMTGEAGARCVLAECLSQVSANVSAVLASDDPEGPHQLRVGLRRLRSAATLFSGVLASAELKRLSREAQWLGREVGRQRDFDVALADLVAPAAEALPGEPGFAALETALADAADAERARLRGTLAGARARGFLLDLSEFVACRGWLDPSDPDQTPRLARPLPETAAAALDRRLARAAKRAKGLDRLSTEQRHELRKELKKLRYSVEFCASLYPEKKVKPFLKRLKALQAVFGSLNDAAMAKELLGGPDAPGSDDPAAARAAGFVLGLHTERAQHGWTEAKALWTALRDTRPFWR